MASCRGYQQTGGAAPTGVTARRRRLVRPPGGGGGGAAPPPRPHTGEAAVVCRAATSETDSMWGGRPGQATAAAAAATKVEGWSVPPAGRPPPPPAKAPNPPVAEAPRTQAPPAADPDTRPIRWAPRWKASHLSVGRPWCAPSPPRTAVWWESQTSCQLRHSAGPRHWWAHDPAAQCAPLHLVVGGARRLASGAEAACARRHLQLRTGTLLGECDGSGRPHRPYRSAPPSARRPRTPCRPG